MNVHAAQHFRQTEFTCRPEAAPLIPFAGIPVGAKQHVPYGKIGIIEGVNAFLMVYAVALRSLEDVPQPMWSFYVPVIDKFGQAAEHHCSCGCHRFKAHAKVQNCAHDHAIEQNLEWMFVKARDDFQALGAMVNLMNPSPKER